MQTIFAHEFHGGKPEEILDAMLDEFAPKLTERDFPHKVLKGILDNHEEILKIIGVHAPQWPVEKIAKVDRATLEIGVYEIAIQKEVPPVVAINEAVEIAKKFGDDSSPKFVNGVLSSIMKKYHGDTKKTGKEDRD